MRSHAAKRGRQNTTPKNRIVARVPPECLGCRPFTAAEKETLRRLAAGRQPADRRRCLAYVSQGIGVSRNQAFAFELIDRLIPDRSQRVRWGACSLLGWMVESHPKRVWPLVVKWGAVRSADIRSAIACCVLEHLLEYHFKQYFELARRIVEAGNARFADTLSMCWKFGQTEEPNNAKAFDALIERIRETRCVT